MEDIEEYWLGEVNRYGEKDVVIYVVGNKIDKAEEREEVENLLGDFSSKNRIKTAFSSAKTGEGVKEFFSQMA